MRRLHTTTGCSRCKLRRKKCDEKRPMCSGCARWPQWRDSCSYGTPDPVPSSSTNTVLQLAKDAPRDISNSVRVRRLGVVRYSGEELEPKVLEVIPDLLKVFFSPVSADGIRDLQTMWQLMLSNEILRNTFVACFSRFLGESSALVRLSQETYGKALKALRSKILQVNLDQATAISVIISMVFLGKLESFAPRSNADALEHWGPLIPLLASDQIEKLSKAKIFPANERTLVMEALLYHVGTHAIFSRSTERVWELWKTHNIYSRLCAHNPEGPDRIKRSPALSGQYLLYHLAFYASVLLRRYSKSQCPASVTNDLERMIRQHDARLDRDFAVMSATKNAIKYRAEGAIYHFFCNSLLICTTALREPSSRQRLQMRQHVDLGMKMFLDLPVYNEVPHLAEHAGHFVLTAIWAAEILACAAYTVDELNIFMNHYENLEKFLDPGHQVRARWIFDQVRACLGKIAFGEKVAGEKVAGERIETGTKDADPAIPAGLRLLNSPIKMPEPEQKAIRL